MKHDVKFRKFLVKEVDRKVAEAFNKWMQRDKYANLYEFIWETSSVDMVKKYMLPNSRKKAGFTSDQLKKVQSAWKAAVEEICQEKSKTAAQVKPAELENSQTLARALDDIMKASGATLKKRYKIFEKSKEYKAAA